MPIQYINLFSCVYSLSGLTVLISSAIRRCYMSKEFLIAIQTFHFYWKIDLISLTICSMNEVISHLITSPHRSHGMSLISHVVPDWDYRYHGYWSRYLVMSPADQQIASIPLLSAISWSRYFYFIGPSDPL